VERNKRFFIFPLDFPLNPPKHTRKRLPLAKNEFEYKSMSRKSAGISTGTADRRIRAPSRLRQTKIRSARRRWLSPRCKKRWPA
jgi:hypothetical protein